MALDGDVVGVTGFRITDEPQTFNFAAGPDHGRRCCAARESRNTLGPVTEEYRAGPTPTSQVTGMPPPRTSARFPGRAEPPIRAGVPAEGTSSAGLLDVTVDMGAFGVAALLVLGPLICAVGAGAAGRWHVAAGADARPARFASPAQYRSWRPNRLLQPPPRPRTDRDRAASDPGAAATARLPMRVR